MKKLNHYVYQITNNINGKIYVGNRSCKCQIDEDTYFGSGTRLKYAIKKYGKENFTKTIIYICETADQAYELEALIVDTDFIKRSDTYNLCGGGTGVGVGESNPKFGKTLSPETRAKISANNSSTMTGKFGELHPMFGKHHTVESIAKMSTAMKGKVHSDETKAKMSISHKGKTFSPETIAKRVATRLANKLTKHGQ